MYYLLKSFLIIIILGIPIILLGQINDKLIFDIGYGYIEGFHSNFKYIYFSNLDIGLGIGSHLTLPPLENDKHFDITVEHNIHFGQQKEQILKPWFSSQRLIYFRTEDGASIFNTISFTPTMGRIIYFTRNLGISIEVGPVINFVIDVEWKYREPGGWIWPVLPGARCQMFYIF